MLNIHQKKKEIYVSTGRLVTYFPSEVQYFDKIMLDN